MQLKFLGSAFMAALLLVGCGEDATEKVSDNTNAITTLGSTLPYTVLDNTIDNGAKVGEKMEIRNGGFGSSAFKDPKTKTVFMLLQTVVQMPTTKTIIMYLEKCFLCQITHLELDFLRFKQTVLS